MSHPHAAASSETTTEPLDLREKGSGGQVSEIRLFMQLQVFTGCQDPNAVIEALKASGREAVVYADINDPQGIGVLLMDEDASYFVEGGRELLNQDCFKSLTRRDEMTMLGRTYAIGHERDLEDWILKKPRRASLSPELPWAVWYPLRRKPEFALLSPREQGPIMKEHAMIGRQYGDEGYAQDIRLTCYGIDKHDNEFVLGIVGSELYPLSRLIQDMRKTQQTARYIESLGPFFVGKAIWQSPLK